jgi:hypothetical protein
MHQPDQLHLQGFAARLSDARADGRSVRELSDDVLSNL